MEWLLQSVVVVPREGVRVEGRHRVREREAEASIARVIHVARRDISHRSVGPAAHLDRIINEDHSTTAEATTTTIAATTTTIAATTTTIEATTTTTASVEVTGEGVIGREVVGE